MEELKPCPFCGGKAEYFEERLYIMDNASMIGVKCTRCGGAYFTADKSKCPNDVFYAWNRRIGTTEVNQYGNNAVNIEGSVCTFNL